MKMKKLRLSKTECLRAALYFTAFFVIFLLSALLPSAETTGKAAIGASVCAVILLAVDRNSQK